VGGKLGVGSRDNVNMRRLGALTLESGGWELERKDSCIIILRYGG
jgi:hypothetical protein